MRKSASTAYPSLSTIHCPSGGHYFANVSSSRFLRPSRSSWDNHSGSGVKKPASVGFRKTRFVFLRGYGGRLRATNSMGINSGKQRSSSKRSNAKMNFARPFTPTANRRLNELIGFLVFVFAVLLVLALVSYSPLDPSLNTAANSVAGHPAHNWIGVVGALVSDIACNCSACRRFLIPAFLAMYSLRWFRSRPISAPYAKTLGAVALLTFLAGLIGLLPWQSALDGRDPVRRPAGPHRRRRAIHYFNVVGAYLVCVAVIAVALICRRRSPSAQCGSGRRRASASSMPRWTALPTGAWNGRARRPPKTWRRNALPPPMPSP